MLPEETTPVAPLIAPVVEMLTVPLTLKASSVLRVSFAERYRLTEFASVPNWIPEATVLAVQVPSQSKHRPTAVVEVVCGSM